MAGLRGGASGTHTPPPPYSPTFSRFHGVFLFLEKITKLYIGAHSLEGRRPFYRESWIRPCTAASFNISSFSRERVLDLSCHSFLNCLTRNNSLLFVLPLLLHCFNHKISLKNASSSFSTVSTFSIEFFTVYTKLAEMAILYSNDLITAKKELPRVGLGLMLQIITGLGVQCLTR